MLTSVLAVIVGQVTPDMLEHMRYGTYIFFGLLTFGGALFIWFVVPETKRLSLEEMDILFGSAGVASADAEKMREINREVGLEEIVRRGSSVAAAPVTPLEKTNESEKTEYIR